MKQIQILITVIINAMIWVFPISVSAQQPRASFKNLPDSLIRNPIFITELDSNYLFLETPSMGSINVCSINKSLELVKKIRLPNSFIRNRYELIKTDSTVSFVSQYRIRDSLYVQLLKLNGALEVVEQLQHAFPLPDQRRSGYSLLIDEKKQSFFLYHIWTFNEDSAFIYGIKTNRLLQMEKEVAYIFPYRSELDTLGNLLMDFKGNIHLLVYDKPFSYKLSSNLQIHSIPADKDELITETFTFQKKKIFGLFSLEDVASDKIRLEGFFLDGQTKNKEGILHIGMPITRGQGLDYKLYPFQRTTLISKEKMNKRNPFRVLNQLKLSFYFDEENKTRLIAEMPPFNMGFNDTVGDYVRSQSRLRLGENTVQSFESVRRYNEVVTPPTTQATNAGRNRQARVTPVQSATNTNTFYDRGMNFIDNRQFGFVKYKASSFRAPKIFSFNLNDKLEWVGYQQKSMDEFFSETYNMRLPIQLGEQFYVFAYGADKQDKPMPILISYEKENPVVLKLSNDMNLQSIKFIQFQKVHANKYIGIYKNDALQVKGMMELEFKKEN